MNLHQIDAEDGFLNGLPELGEGSSYGQWANVFSREYDDLRDGVEDDKDDVIDGYGGKDPAEFFAVVTEGFFLRPSEMKGRHPELYAEMIKFYKVDPSRWNV
jgi:Mlc titration factor MtfA (ptsG expression regulator)